MTIISNTKEDLFLCMDYIRKHIENIGDDDAADVITLLAEELYDRGYPIEDLVAFLEDIGR